MPAGKWCSRSSPCCFEASMAKRKQGELADGPPDGVVFGDTSAVFGGSEVVKNCYHLHPIWKKIGAGGGKDRYNQLVSISEADHVQRSKGRDAAGFCECGVVNNYYHLHPVWKAIQGKDYYNQVPWISQFHRGKKLEVQDAADSSDPAVVKNIIELHPIWKAIQGRTGKSCCDQVPSIPQFPRGKRSKGRVRKPPTGQDAESSEVKILKESKSQCLVSINTLKPMNMRGRRKAKPSVPRRLDSQKFEFYIENIWRRLTEDRKNTFTYLDSLWFHLYTKGSLKTKVLGWIQRKNIFSKKYVFVPIVQWGHWFLLILCHLDESPDSTTSNRCLLLLDSLQTPNSKQLESGIRRFVLDIFKTEERLEEKELINNIPLFIPKVPQQRNGEDCGYFVLCYINQFVQSAPDHFTFCNGYPHFMKEDWFKPEEVESFIKSLDSITHNNP